MIRFDGNCHRTLPTAQGVYRIFDMRNPSATLRAGRTLDAAGGLRQRVYQNHFMGTQAGNLRAQLVAAKDCANLEDAKEFMREQLAAQVLFVEDEGERARLEYYMIRELHPRFAGGHAEAAAVSTSLAARPTLTSAIPPEEPLECVDLAFIGPLGWFASPGVPAVAEADIARRPGIYVWTYPTDQGEFVYYVGETARSLLRRMNEHLAEQLSGRYRLYEPEAFARTEKRLLWRGVYGDGAEVSLEGFLDQLQQFAPALTRFVKSMRFHLAVMEAGDRLRRRVEAALAQHLYDQEGIVGEFQERGIHYEPRRDEEQPVEIRLSWQTRPRGVPDRLLA